MSQQASERVRICGVRGGEQSPAPVTVWMQTVGDVARSPVCQAGKMAEIKNTYVMADAHCSLQLTTFFLMIQHPSPPNTIMIKLPVLTSRKQPEQ